MLEDVSEQQLDGLGGGDALRREMLAFDKSSKRAVARLQDALCVPRVATPLLALVAQQRGHALFEGSLGHVKLLGQLFDRCQGVFVQLVDFLARNNASQPKNNALTQAGAAVSERKAYAELLPCLERLCVGLRMEPQVALHAARPLMQAAARQRRARAAAAAAAANSGKKQTAADSDDRLERWDPCGASLKAELRTALPNQARGDGVQSTWGNSTCVVFESG